LSDEEEYRKFSTLISNPNTIQGYEDVIVRIKNDLVLYNLKMHSNIISPQIINLIESYNVKIDNYYHNIDAYTIEIPLNSLEFVEKASILPEVIFIYPTIHYELTYIPNDPYWDLLYGMELINMPEVWDITFGGNVTVAILDTGLDRTHPDLLDRYVGGWNYIDNNDDPYDDHGHGTHVAGTIAAHIDNEIGVAGVGDFDLLVYKIFSSSGYAGDTAAADALMAGVDAGAKVLSNSWGGGPESALINAAIDYAVENNVLPVFAAGNNGMSSPFYPAAYPNAFAVGATDINDELAWFSNYGDWVDIVAPGVDIFSTLPGNSYEAWSGTSMATPHVAGVAAMLYSYYPDITVEQVKSILISSAVDLGEPGFDIYFANGRLDASTAIFGLPDYDLKVSLYASNSFLINADNYINASIQNIGALDINEADLFLYVDSINVNHITTPLKSGETVSISYLIHPTEPQSFNITVYAPPIDNETKVTNNIVTKLIDARNPLEIQIGDWHLFDWFQTGEFVYIEFIDQISPTELYAFIEFRDEFGNYYGDDYMIVDIVSGLITSGWFEGYYYIFQTYTDIDLGSQVPWYNQMAEIIDEIVFDFNSIPRDSWVGLLLSWQRDVIFDKETGLLLYYSEGNNLVLVDSSKIKLDHDLAVVLQTPQSVAFGSSFEVTFGVANKGLNDEHNITLSFYVDFELYSSFVIDYLATDNYYTETLWFNAESEGYITFEVFVDPVDGEEVVNNNYANKSVFVSDIKQYFELIVDYEWIDAQSLGIPLIIDCDDCYNVLDLPFNFQFYDEVFNQVYVSSNGLLSFLHPNTDTGGVYFPETDPYYWYLIAPYWDDLYIFNEAIVYSYITDEFVVIEYRDAYYFPGTDQAATFQVVLFADGRILFQYEYIHYHRWATVGLNYGPDPNYFNQNYDLYSGLYEYAILYTTDVDPFVDVNQYFNIIDSNFDNFYDTMALDLQIKYYTNSSELIETEVNFYFFNGLEYQLIETQYIIFYAEGSGSNFNYFEFYANESGEYKLEILVFREHELIVEDNYFHFLTEISETFFISIENYEIDRNANGIPDGIESEILINGFTENFVEIEIILSMWVWINDDWVFIDGMYFGHYAIYSFQIIE
jgi:thermitase